MMGSFATLDFQHTRIEYCYAECRDYLNVIPSAIVQNVVMLNVVTPQYSSLCYTRAGFSRLV